jgi:hypothetical protein
VLLRTACPGRQLTISTKIGRSFGMCSRSGAAKTDVGLYFGLLGGCLSVWVVRLLWEELARDKRSFAGTGGGDAGGESVSGGGEGNGFEGAGKAVWEAVGSEGTGGTGGTSWLCRDDDDKLLIEKVIDFAFFKEKERLRVGGA